MSIKLVIADRHELVRVGLFSMLQGSDIEIVGEAKCSDEVVWQALNAAPDVVLLDLRLPPKNGFLSLRRIRAANSGLPVVLFSAFENPRFLALANSAGAAGFVSKGTSREELIAALRDAVDERVTWKRRSLPSLGDGGFRADELSEIELALTPRERQVLDRLASGMTNKQISHSLDVSYETVKEHVQHILQKVGVTDRTKAAVWAVNRRLP